MSQINMFIKANDKVCELLIKLHNLRQTGHWSLEFKGKGKIVPVL